MNHPAPRFVASSLVLLAAGAFAGCHSASSPPAGDLVVQVVVLEHTRAPELLPVLDRICAEAVSRDGAEPVRLVCQEDKNCLLVSASKARVGEVLELIATLDVEPDGS